MIPFTIFVTEIPRMLGQIQVILSHTLLATSKTLVYMYPITVLKKLIALREL